VLDAFEEADATEEAGLPQSTRFIEFLVNYQASAL
jgi:hypothetical protein